MVQISHHAALILVADIGEIELKSAHFVKKVSKSGGICEKVNFSILT